MIDLNFEDINRVDNSDLQTYITRKSHRKNINSQAGEHHYKLLAYLSLNLDDGYIVELGTHNGTSAMAMSKNKKVTVHTFDISDLWTANIVPNNVIRYHGNIFEIGKGELLLNAIFIFVDIDHRGIIENKIHTYLNANNYEGFAVFDDIHYNDKMRTFWASIKNDKKDITNVGHGYSPHEQVSGTGIVFYKKNT